MAEFYRSFSSHVRPASRASDDPARVLWENEFFGAPAPAASRLKHWTGSEWAQGVLKRYDGAAWAVTNLKVRIGAAWVTV
jgi:hypothetical protein